MIKNLTNSKSSSIDIGSGDRLTVENSFEIPANIDMQFVGSGSGVMQINDTLTLFGNIEFGAKTPLSTIVKGVTLLGVLLGLGYLLSAIPNACLAAILFKLGIDILDYRILPVLRKITISDLFIFIVVLFITVYQNLMVAVAVGVIIAIIKSFNQLISKSNYEYKVVSILESDFVLNQKQKKELDALSVKVLKLNGPLFFGSTEQLISVYNNAQNHKILIIDMSIVSSIDLTGIYSLEDLVKGAQSNGIITYVSSADQNIKQVMNNVDFIKNIGKEYYKDSTESVIFHILENNNQNK